MGKGKRKRSHNSDSESDREEDDVILEENDHGAHAISLKKKRKSKSEREASRVINSSTSIAGSDLIRSAYSTHEFNKNFWNGPVGENPPSEELKKTRQACGINVKGNLELCPPPSLTIENSFLPNEFVEIFKILHLVNPTPVQMQCWPSLLSGANVLGIAPTGSGKTLSYGLPMIPHINQLLKSNIKVKNTTCAMPIALVLVPTRELALQVAKVFKSFKKVSSINVSAIYGGEDKKKQVEELLEGPGSHIVVGTPGRLLDLFTHKNLSFCNVTYLVVDEADRMLALGFQEQITLIAEQIRPDKQTALFSATFPGKLREVSQNWIQDAVIVRVNTMEVRVENTDKGSKNTSNGVDLGVEEGGNDVSTMDSSSVSHENKITPVTIAPSSSLTISDSIKQSVHVCATHKKPRLLIRYITTIREQEAASKCRQPGAMMIFCTKIKTLSFVFDFLRRQGVKNIAMMHGQLNQKQREQTLTEFAAGKISTLCSTDVAARGIHIKRLKYVVNYDFPTNLEQYCHRVGRTGRQGEIGYAYSLLTRNIAPLASGLIALLQSTGQSVEPNLIKLEEEFRLGTWRIDESEEMLNASGEEE